MAKFYITNYNTKEKEIIKEMDAFANYVNENILEYAIIDSNGNITNEEDIEKMAEDYFSGLYIYFTDAEEFISKLYGCKGQGIIDIMNECLELGADVKDFTNRNIRSNCYNTFISACDVINLYLYLTACRVEWVIK